jgi:hypothetical protein
MQIDHLHGGEFFDGTARRAAGRQGVEAPILSIASWRRD